MASLLDRRLLVVTGKGGTGKTTVSAALGLAATRRGKRAVVCEVARQERLGAMFGAGELGHAEREIAPGLYGISIDPDRAKEEWLRNQLHSGPLAGVLGHSRIFQYLTAAAPGLRELVTMGKVWDMAQLERRLAPGSYDLAIVDAPATGHGIAMLRAPKTYADIARVGPIHRQATRIHGFVTDPACTGVVAVALPEEMPVNETLELGARLRDELGMGVDQVVVNGLYPDRFTDGEAERLASLDGAGSEAQRAALEAALSEHRRARAQRTELRRLESEARAPVTTLPYLFQPDLGAEELELLSQELEPAL
ncbi:MAG TPA: ArsA-related P-loop ATPase [Thermoleophilaceae bacterium]|nr:ArsA-related P-loop ATPase [Thermoleophilaceae bacterium]